MALCIARGKRWAEQSETEARLLRIEAEAVFVSLYEQSDEMVDRIEARFALDPAPEVSFDTVMEPLTGQHVVRQAEA